jgi:gluconate kinase
VAGELAGGDVGPDQGNMWHGVRLGSPLADWWRWQWQGELRRAAATEAQRRARGLAGSSEARDGAAQCVAREA